jgi:uncharacterized protein YeaO (DUF488 family)
MALKLRTFRIGDRPKRAEGLRLAATRLLPRGVRKADYARLGLFDLWFPALAPSQGLLKSRNTKGFMKRYEAELRRETDARQAVLLVAEVAKRTPIAIGCYCADETTCHRSVLAGVIRAAADGRWPK